jgi:hypothetical protein
MKDRLLLLCLPLTLLQSAAAATVAFGNLTTEYQDINGFTTVNQPSTLIAVDLSSPVGLISGEAVRVTFSPVDLIWIMAIHIQTGMVELHGKVLYEMIVGAQTFTCTDEWTAFGPAYVIDAPPGGDAPPEGTAYTDPVGYSTGPTPLPKSFEVPWGTDLRAVGVRITDQSFYISDVPGYLTNSSMYVGGGSISTTSVPEQSSVLLVTIAAGMIAFRRRR